MLKRLLGLGGALATGLLAACDEAPQSQQLFLEGAGTWSYLVDAVKDGPLWVDVAGNPFAVADADAARAMAEAVERGMTALKITTTTDRAAAARPMYRLKVVLNPGPSANFRKLCQEMAPAGPPPEGKLEILMGFCVEDEVRGAARGSLPTTDNPRAEPLVQLIGRMTRQVLARNTDR
ncbi:hypothetical protein [Roseospirillum parvum]|uniref:Lipoprotein n=1 Tax=Roseospirillum parvum TaxID=83401 RepID=A0A1G7U389_9PROT|nr:hypothetical protein [Roseospirillum parvum]SDG41864.1 hypothetical protein SAMN05421742_101188 [Roseospirillum parvum]